MFFDNHWGALERNVSSFAWGDVWSVNKCQYCQFLLVKATCWRYSLLQLRSASWQRMPGCIQKRSFGPQWFALTIGRLGRASHSQCNRHRRRGLKRRRLFNASSTVWRTGYIWIWWSCSMNEQSSPLHSVEVLIALPHLTFHNCICTWVRCMSMWPSCFACLRPAHALRTCSHREGMLDMSFCQPRRTSWTALIVRKPPMRCECCTWFCWTFIEKETTCKEEHRSTLLAAQQRATEAEIQAGYRLLRWVTVIRRRTRRYITK